MAIKHLQNRIAASGTTIATDRAAAVRQLVISCSNAGTAWTLAVRDKQSPARNLVPAFTLTVVPPIIIKFDEPVPMRGGIDLVTAGTPGVVDVWTAIDQ